MPAFSTIMEGEVELFRLAAVSCSVLFPPHFSNMQFPVEVRFPAAPRENAESA